MKLGMSGVHNPQDNRLLLLSVAVACCCALFRYRQGMCRHYVFVSSAGAYKANNIEPMHFEGDERKASAGEN